MPSIRTVLREAKCDIPYGSLYYPFCGHDTYKYISNFWNDIKEFHFSDIHCPSLPIESEVSLNTDSLNRSQIRRHISRNEISELIQTKKDYPAAELVIEGIGRINVPRHVAIRDTFIQNKTKQKISVFSHKFDSLLTLAKLKNISILVYLGDSPGEGGSGQLWMEPPIFEVLVSKMIGGGFIITDALTPNNCRNEKRGNTFQYHDTIPHEKIYHFVQFGKTINHITTNGRRYGDIHIWQVT